MLDLLESLFISITCKVFCVIVFLEKFDISLFDFRWYPLIMRDVLVDLHHKLILFTFHRFVCNEGVISKYAKVTCCCHTWSCCIGRTCHPILHLALRRGVKCLWDILVITQSILSCWLIVKESVACVGLTKNSVWTSRIIGRIVEIVYVYLTFMILITT